MSEKKDRGSFSDSGRARGDVGRVGAPSARTRAAVLLRTARAQRKAVFPIYRYHTGIRTFFDYFKTGMVWPN